MKETPEEAAAVAASHQLVPKAKPAPSNSRMMSRLYHSVRNKVIGGTSDDKDGGGGGGVGGKSSSCSLAFRNAPTATRIPLPLRQQQQVRRRHMSHQNLLSLASVPEATVAPCYLEHGTKSSRSAENVVVVKLMRRKRENESKKQQQHEEAEEREEETVEERETERECWSLESAKAREEDYWDSCVSRESAETMRHRSIIQRCVTEGRVFLRLAEKIRRDMPEIGNFRDDSSKDAKQLPPQQQEKVTASSSLDMGLLPDLVAYARAVADVLFKNLGSRDEEMERVRASLEASRRQLEEEEASKRCGERDSLRSQLHQGSRQTLTASGAGDVSKELADLQDKIAYFQAQYYQLLSERNGTLEQMRSAQAQKGELEEVKRQHRTMVEEVDEAKQKIAALQLERAKYIEEKNVLRQIYQRLKAEVSKVHTLEGAIVGMNMEANRLSIIAEYNQQLGEKLQSEVMQRDEKISVLQSDVCELNNAQMEHAKDKVALCVELREACNLNDQLSTSLMVEHEKQRELESCAAAQLVNVQEMLRQERTALKDLLKTYGHVVKQRDDLSAQLAELNKQKKRLEVAEGGEKEKLEEMSEKLRAQLAEAQARADSLEDSKGYLQNTIQRLQADLDSARQSEVEQKKRVKEVLAENEQLKETIEEEKKKSRMDAEKMHEEFENSDKLKCELEVLKKKVETLEAEKERYAKTIEKLHEQLANLENSYKELSGELQQAETLVEDVDVQSQLLSESSNQQVHLRWVSANLEQELRKSRRTVAALESEKLHLENQLKDVIEDSENKYLGCRKELNELLQQCADQKSNMRSSLEELVQKLDKTRADFIAEHNAHRCLLQAHKDVAAKLLKAVHLLIDEKLLRQQAECRTAGFVKQVDVLMNEKRATEDRLKQLSDELHEAHDRVEELLQDKQTLQEFLADLQKLHDARRRRGSSTANSGESSNTSARGSSSSSTTLLKQTHERAQQLRKELEDNHKIIIQLKSEIANLNQQLTVMEFQKSEVAIRLHENISKLKGEQTLNAELINIHNKILDEILRLTKDGKMKRDVCDILIQIIQQQQQQRQLQQQQQQQQQQQLSEGGTLEV